MPGRRARPAALVAAGALLIMLAGAPAARSEDGAEIAAMERDVLRQTNAIRRERGLRPLEPNGSLARLAREHSCAMARAGKLSHTGPRGATLGDRGHASGESYRQVGENVAMNLRAREPVTTAMRGWMKSEGHRANILEPGFTETGAGVCRAGATVYFTQIFRLR